MFELTSPQPEKQGPQILTHSRMSCFRDCPRKHLIRYELGISQESDDLPRRFGSALHRAFELTDLGQPIELAALGLDDEFEMAMLAAVYTEHTARYQGSDPEPVAAELQFDLPLINPETGRPTPTWRLQGKIDRIVRLADGRLALQEYKTTTRDFAPGADYWMRLHLDQQLSIYVIAARELGYNVETVLYDVTRRPALRPLKATPEDVRKYTKEGKLYANQRAEDETPEAYMARIQADIQERPEHYFARIEIARLDQDLDECRAELWQQQLAIRAAQRTNHWYRNPNSCYGVIACDYLAICQNRDLDQVTPQGFVRRTEIHPELMAAPVEG